MKKLYFLLLTLIGLMSYAQTPIITAIVDGDCSGGNPKLLEIYASGTVDFSLYSLENQTNANTTWGNTQDLSALGIVTNSFVYITTTGSETALGSDFPSITFTNPNVLASNTMNVNGDDRVRIILTADSTVIDQFGAEGIDGTGTTWEYLDSYAKRNNNTGPDGGFNEANWTFGGVSALNTLGVCQGGADTFETLIGGIGTYTSTGGSCGVSLSSAVYNCMTNTVGDNNDGVTIDISYSGSDAGITSVTSNTASVSGDDPAVTAGGTITLSGLSEGDAWDLTLNGGDCDGTTLSGTVPAAQCDPAPNTCFDLSAGPELFELVTVASNSDVDVWTETAGTYSMNGFCGGGCMEESNTWLIFGPLDMTGVTDLELLFDATEGFDGTDLNVQYTTDYSANCPDGATWTSALTVSASGSYSADLSGVSGTAVFLGIQYLDSDGSFSSWDLSNVSLAAFGSCPALGTRPVSDCAVCDVTLGTETYTCATNTVGDNNDGVTVNIPYSGLDNTIVNVSVTGGTPGGDDPALTADGTITISGLTEGGAWSVTLNGGDCDGTTLSGTVPSSACDPVFLLINEINADPDATNGDANGDGTVNTSEDEFVEIYNSGATSIDLTDFTISDAVTVRHTFPSGTVLAPNSFITVFGGGTPTGINGIAQTASSGGLGLNNGGDSVIIANSSALVILQEDYGAAGNNQSIARSPDFTGAFVDHSTIVSNPVLFSPGARNDGQPLSTENFETAQFSIYPNPTNTGFVTITSSSSDAMNVQVFDILGKQVKNETLTNNTLNVSNLNTGVYILKITQNNASTTKKLVIK
ncbi:T9SS type A sorting domain-containing protein [Winogradskyella sp. HB-48]|uniref:T9SS type A sorting domain-containing protein n=1 Tax=Winogradskyella sp. HB-48 TaxID=3416808 RepID=UPI003CEA6EB3